MNNLIIIVVLLCSGNQLAANQLRRSSRNRPVFRQQLMNEGDVQYSGTISVGGQDIAVVPDTGSFELVFFSDRCKLCGENDKLLHSKKSKSFREGELRSEQDYGSGSTQSVEAHDDVSLGDLISRDQLFWDVYDADMPLLKNASFQGIFGLGPPSSGPKLAQQNAAQVRKEVKALEKAGRDITEFKPIIEQYEHIAKAEEDWHNNMPLWLKVMDVRHFSVCLEKDNGGAGWVVYNDDTDLTFFPQTVQVSGTLYWSVSLTSMAFASTDSLKSMNDDSLNLLDEEMEVMLDTGTSLIAAPQEALDRLTRLTSKFTRLTDGCKNLDMLPNLEFTMGGEDFSLPPEAYMGEMNDDDNMPEWASNAMPHLKLIRDEYMKNKGVSLLDKPKTMCVPLLMSMGQEKMWILGMPFFRKYYTRFSLGDNGMDGQAVHFAEANARCELGKDYLREEAGRTRGIPKVVDARKLIPPRRLLKKLMSD